MPCNRQRLGRAKQSSESRAAVSRRPLLVLRSYRCSVQHIACSGLSLPAIARTCTYAFCLPVTIAVRSSSDHIILDQGTDVVCRNSEHYADDLEVDLEACMLQDFHVELQDDSPRQVYRLMGLPQFV